MITAIGTNVLLDVLIPNEKFCDASVLLNASTLISSPSRKRPQEAHFLAGRAWRVYRKQGGQRARILADFLIGAHAHVQASRLLSRDRGFYRKLFPKLSLMDPSA
jgi:hypothetical protein